MQVDEILALFDKEQRQEVEFFGFRREATPQVVRVSAVDDNVAEGPHTGLVTHTVASTDADYNNLAVPDVTANVIDDDLLLLTIVQSQGSTDVAEAGAGDSYTIALASDLAPVVWVQFEDPTGQVVADCGEYVRSNVRS